MGKKKNKRFGAYLLGSAGEILPMTVQAKYVSKDPVQVEMVLSYKRSPIKVEVQNLMITDKCRPALVKALNQTLYREDGFKISLTVTPAPLDN